MYYSLDFNKNIGFSRYFYFCIAKPDRGYRIVPFVLLRNLGGLFWKKKESIRVSAIS